MNKLMGFPQSNSVDENIPVPKITNSRYLNNFPSQETGSNAENLMIVSAVNIFSQRED